MDVKHVVAGLLLLALAAAGCSSDDASSTPATTTNGSDVVTNQPGTDDPSGGAGEGDPDVPVEVPPGDSLSSLGIELPAGQLADYDGVEMIVTDITAADMSDAGEPSELNAVGAIEVSVSGVNNTDAEAPLPTISVLCMDDDGEVDLGAGGLSVIIDEDTVFSEILAPGEEAEGSARVTVPDCDDPVVTIARLSGGGEDGPPVAHMQIPEGARP